MRADPRADVPSAALTLMRAGAEPDAEAVRAAWEAAGPAAHPGTRAVPRRAGSVPHGPVAAADDREAKAWEMRVAVIDALGRTKIRLGKRYEDRLPAHRHPFENPGCASCDRGFIDVTEDGSRVAPCPACRPARREDTA